MTLLFGIGKNSVYFVNLFIEVKSLQFNNELFFFQKSIQKNGIDYKKVYFCDNNQILFFMKFCSPTASLCFNRPTKRFDWLCKKPDSAISSLLRMVKMNDKGMGDEVRYSKRGNGGLYCLELLWYTNDSEATWIFSEEGLISEGKITEGDEIRSDWGRIRKCMDI